MSQYTFTVVIERDEDGVFVATCPALQGCYTQGETYQQALDNIREAIELHLETRRDLGEPIPKEVGTTTLTVTV